MSNAPDVAPAAIASLDPSADADRTTLPVASRAGPDDPQHDSPQHDSSSSDCGPSGSPSSGLPSFDEPSSNAPPFDAPPFNEPPFDALPLDAPSSDEPSSHASLDGRNRSAVASSPDAHDPSASDARALPTNDVPRTLRIAADDAAGQDYPAATLYVVATPIGNRADITVRALACLARVDAIAAEDTRTARQLLHHYGIDKPMLAAHRHNEHEAAASLVARIAGGARVAYLSDAGTPGVSDPGARLVAAVRGAGFRVIPVPGPSALTTAVSAAGLADGPVHFVGFLPAKGGQVATMLRALRATPAHLVFYEAPHRIVETLAAIATHFAGRDCVIAKELTKRFETIHRCPVEDAVAWLTADPQRQRGEFVVVVEAARDGDGDDERALARALPILAKLCAALSVSEAASLTAEVTGVSRKALYAHALKMRDRS